MSFFLYIIEIFYEPKKLLGVKDELVTTETKK
jgi:hypothetical protein